jgi:RsiW-degrading membrane proteinase PrsW (M82 family)
MDETKIGARTKNALRVLVVFILSALALLGVSTTLSSGTNYYDTAVKSEEWRIVNLGQFYIGALILIVMLAVAVVFVFFEMRGEDQ